MQAKSGCQIPSFVYLYLRNTFWLTNALQTACHTNTAQLKSASLLPSIKKEKLFLSAFRSEILMFLFTKCKPFSDWSNNPRHSVFSALNLKLKLSHTPYPKIARYALRLFVVSIISAISI